MNIWGITQTILKNWLKNKQKLTFKIDYLFEFRVKGVERLRIMDASILPSPITGMPNSVIVALAERAADLIKVKEQNIFSKPHNH